MDDGARRDVKESSSSRQDPVSKINSLEYVVKCVSFYASQGIPKYELEKYEIIIHGLPSEKPIKSKGDLAKTIVDDYESYCVQGEPKPYLRIHNFQPPWLEGISASSEGIVFGNGSEDKGDHNKKVLNVRYEGPLTRTEMLEILMKVGSYLEKKEKK